MFHRIDKSKLTNIFRVYVCSKSPSRPNEPKWNDARNRASVELIKNVLLVLLF